VTQPHDDPQATVPHVFWSVQLALHCPNPHVTVVQAPAF
jgi:hypothetical protein